jgi:hypothetical protein
LVASAWDYLVVTSEPQDGLLDYREQTTKNSLLFFPTLCLAEFRTNFVINSSILFISTMTSTLESVVETPETVTEVYVHGTLDEQPVMTHKSKKHVKDRNKS